MCIPGLRERTEERMPCGCSIVVPSVSTVGPNHVISYCPTHAAAPALLAACEEAYEFLDDRTDTYPEPCEDVPALSVMITLKFAIDKAKGDQ